MNIDGKTFISASEIKKSYPGSKLEQQGSLWVLCVDDLCIPFSKDGMNRYVEKDGDPYLDKTAVDKVQSKSSSRPILPYLELQNVRSAGVTNLKDYFGKKTLLFCWASW